MTLVSFEDVIPFLVPAITALLIFATQWHKRGASVEISANDIKIMKDRIVDIETKVDKISDHINKMVTDAEVFRYRMKVLERTVDDAINPEWRKSYRQPFRPKDSNGE